MNVNQLDRFWDCIIYSDNSVYISDKVQDAKRKANITIVMYIFISLRGESVITGCGSAPAVLHQCHHKHPEATLTYGGLWGSAVLQPLPNDTHHWKNN